MNGPAMSEAIDKVLAGAVADGAVPHVAAIAADADGLIYEGAFGPRKLGQPEPVSTDGTEFPLMSMTKIVATVAALQLAEQGSLDLDAPVDEYRPEFADVQVLDGFDGDKPRLRQPASRATVRQLITHTSGLGYWFLEADLARYERVTGVPNVTPGLIEALGAPLVADPGTGFHYGISTDWLGRVVEAVAGRELDAVVADGITGPLGMDGTLFMLPPERWEARTTVHLKDQAGNWLDIGDTTNRVDP